MAGTKVTPHDLTALERAAQLKAITNFEQSFIIDLLNRYKTYGKKMMLSESQRKILNELAERYLMCLNILECE